MMLFSGNGINYLEKNPDKKAASILFQVGIATIFRWVSGKKLKGNVEPLGRKEVLGEVSGKRFC